MNHAMSIARLPSRIADPAVREDAEANPSRPAIPLPQNATLSEIFAGDGRDAGAIGFALAQARGDKPLLWVQDRMSILETGRPYPPGMSADLIHVEARDAKAVLWAMEEGLKCAALHAVVGEIWGSPKTLDFTATRRLAVSAERSGVAAVMLLFGAVPNLSGARMRWRVSSRPSPPHPWDPSAPGAQAWSLDLFKARGVPPGRWEAFVGADGHEAHGLHLFSPLVDGVPTAADGRSAA